MVGVKHESLLFILNSFKKASKILISSRSETQKLVAYFKFFKTSSKVQKVAGVRRESFIIFKMCKDLKYSYR